MMRTTRIVLMLTAAALLMPGPCEIARAQESTAVTLSRKTLTIVGRTGMRGVTLQGLPGNPVSDENGMYAAEVPYGWSGRVIPVKAGYEFVPRERSYERVGDNLRSEDYTTRVLTFTISGKVGVAGVTMKGLPGEPITNAGGQYAAQVEYGWSGTVSPTKEGYRFEPPSREYTRVTDSQPNQDYKAEMLTVTISDAIVIGREPLQGVVITADPGGHRAVTDSRGRYSIDVPYGWSGRLTLEKPGFDFDPDSMPFTNITSDIVDGKPVSSADRPSTPRRRSTGGTYARAVVPLVRDDVLVIPTREVSPQQFTETTEDMRVMLHILREKLGEPRTIHGVLVDYGDFFSGNNQAVKGLYVQGYAAIFMLRTDFPLSVPKPPDQAEAQKAEPADPIWEQARNRLYAPPGAMPYGPRGMSREADERSFEQLKEDLIRTLRHAANIRNIDPNEWIIVAVTGQSDAGFSGGMGMMGGMGGYGMMGGMGGYGSGMMGGMGAYGGGMMGGYGGSSVSGGGGGFYMDSRSSSGASSSRPGTVLPQAPPTPAPATVLTIQVKKSDLDALAKGSLSFQQFQEKVTVFTY